VCSGRSCASGRIDARPSEGDVVRRGFLRSPNWPGEYPVDVDCEWTISAERGRHILVVVSRVELAAGDTWRTTDERHCPTTNSSTLGDWLLITDSTGKGGIIAPLAVATPYGLGRMRVMANNSFDHRARLALPRRAVYTELDILVQYRNCIFLAAFVCVCWTHG